MGWFNRFIQGATNKYLVAVGYIGRKISVIVFMLLILFALNAFFIKITPTSFLPDEDQGIIMVNVQLPEGASNVRTKAVNEKILEAIKDHPAIESVMTMEGYSIMAGQGENVGFAVISLKNWAERKGDDMYSTNVLRNLMARVSNFSEAKIQMFEMPAIPGLGSTNAMDFKIQAVDNTDMKDLECVYASGYGFAANFIGIFNL